MTNRRRRVVLIIGVQCSSRREEALLFFAKRLEPPHVGCYEFLNAAANSKRAPLERVPIAGIFHRTKASIAHGRLWIDLLIFPRLGMPIIEQDIPDSPHMSDAINAFVGGAAPCSVWIHIRV